MALFMPSESEVLNVGDLVTLRPLERTNTTSLGLLMDIDHRPGGWCKIYWADLDMIIEDRTSSIKVVSKARREKQ